MTRRLILIRWSFYSVITLLVLLLQSQLLGRITVWGVYPVVLPCLAAVAATMERLHHAVIFSLILGVVCDTLFAALLPCFYVLLFLLVAVLASLTARHLIVPGFYCSLLCCGEALLLSGGLCALTMVFRGAPGAAALGLMLRETLISLPFALVLIHPAFRYIHRITTP